MRPFICHVPRVLFFAFLLLNAGHISADERQAASGAALESLQQHLAVDVAKRAKLDGEDFAQAPLTKDDAAAARKLLWQDHATRIRNTRAAEMKERRLRDGDLEMPFFWKTFGEKPETGWSLYISLHGGGGTTKQVNDQQWRNQQGLYQLKSGIYLVPRAPTNTWNLWHQGHIDGMFDRLIENFVVFEGVDPNRVYLMGYSAGGDGVYQLAPRMADRLAAAAMMAGHPNETSPRGLRNLAFTIHVGGNDAAYNRNKVAEAWQKQLADLKKADPDGYEHWVKIYPGKGHWLNREDAAALPWMAKFRRQTTPSKVVWKQDDVTHSRFYWLAVDGANRKARTEIVASLAGQTINVEAKEVGTVVVRLNDELLNLDKPVTVTSGSEQLFDGLVNRTIGVIAQTIEERGDPNLVFSSELSVSLVK
jgi:poly(3-hydroxybutyrate) depolymerase